MKMPMKWAQDFADITPTPQQFADRMTMTGSKVETFESEADHIKNVVIGRIAQIERHPDSDHLWVCQVDVGASQPVQIVTGAQNLKQGDLCPAALHGARLPNGTEIKRGKLRGLESGGMLCSLAELGLTIHDFPNAVEDGILVLDTPVPPGTNAATALGMDDTTFEFEITPNRPDCLSVRGLAREAAASFGVPFRPLPPAPPLGSGDISTMLSADISADTCLRYCAAMVQNVRIQPSPQWLRQRLRNAGVRPINNIVDITNYVMLEYGQPMHAFDFAYVKGAQITVRMAQQDESIVTLDDVQRPLSPDMMVIADASGPIALAGIMGGEYSGVYDTTQNVVFESACFDGPSVRATSRRLALRTESSTRFEKGLDPENAAPALARALELVAQLGAGDIVGGMIDVYPSPRRPRQIPLCPGAVSRLLGIETPRQTIVDILLPLGFEVNGDTITIPTSRADVTQDCDIAEEVARFVGYNNIPATNLSGSATALPTARQSFDKKMCATLAGYGLWQCETFSFYSPKCFDLIRLAQDNPLRGAIRLLHPLGEDTSIMRTTALPSMLEVVARNWAARTENAALFEQATEYLPASDPAQLPTERQKLILAAYGDTWDYFALKGAVEGLLATAGVSAYEVEAAPAPGDTWHPGRCADIWLMQGSGKSASRGAYLGRVGELHPLVCANYGIKPRVVAADIDLDALFAARGGTPQFSALPKFPAVTRDLALVADTAVPAAAIVSRIRAAAGKQLESLRLFDVYTGDKLGLGKKSLAYNLVFRDNASTLTDSDVDASISRILKSLSQIDVVLRS